ncbi:UDP-N-acetylglucosamine 2-epimerase [Peribacillus simplex]|uniref:GDP/UDP-N,N'-diacetylbacillosamine 2-epimerase (Hydrolyzing) n=1 Tax=Peribacillus simplex TaxID=1478 RepID=A0A9W4PH30_9BACI|nr:UDP-N-acetylglucosamine 2-epimerase [Peribacillus simplex]WHX89196.1 UDP-N-acetylglucosamine 2-epimerase [Peribacillus simplex]CAH0259995.1 GDP/UDP-N,N'-diacetylbacillosamine 2-epimerase (hydrolyzing) [Peribacillus simplex]
MTKKEILCITGTRADYGIYRPLLLKLEKDPAFNLSLIVTGMHLLQEYGETIQEVQKDKLKISATPSILVKGDNKSSMAQSLGLGLFHFSEIIKLKNPDFLLVLGDRGEMLAAAISAHYLNIPIVHFHGGEVSGSADDSIRHAITKLAHLHFVSTEKSYRTLLHFGEEDWRIHVIGSLRKKEIIQVKNQSFSEIELLRKKYSIQTNKNLLIVAFHPDSRDAIPVEKQVETLLFSLKPLCHEQFIFIGANSDAGGDFINQKIKEFCHLNRAATSFYYSIPQEDYLFLLSQANVLVGNSSSGLIEAPFFNLPYVLIGNRQKGRERGSNVVETPYNEGEITAAIKTVLLTEKSPSSNPFDIVKCPEDQVIKVLKETTPDKWILINKNITKLR